MLRRFATVAALLILAAASSAQAPKTFPAAKHKGGELRYVAGVPVLTVGGTPQEIGEQFGVLAVKNAPGLDALLVEFLKDTKMEEAFDGIKLLAGTLKKNLPADHLAELDKAAEVGNLKRDVAYFANTVYDLRTGMGCATLVVDPARSTTDGPLFGRNFDWIPSKGLIEHTLVVVYRPAGKKAFATVTVCPITGCISGMNEDGVAVTINEIYVKQSKDRPDMNWKGTPTLALFRQVLEECGSVAAAEQFLRDAKRTTTACMTICDPAGGAVFEITPNTVAVRKAVNDVCCCTNHFRTAALGTGETCVRMDKLLPLQQGDAKYGVADVFAGLDAVHQGKMTVQAMVFEPKARKLHLKIGDLKDSATKKDAVTLEPFKK